MTGAAGMGGGLTPPDFRYRHSDFNTPISIEAPPVEETVVVETPPAITPVEASDKLGFEFPLPEGAHVAIYGAVDLRRGGLTAAEPCEPTANRHAVFISTEGVWLVDPTLRRAGGRPFA